MENIVTKGLIRAGLATRLCHHPCVRPVRVAPLWMWKAFMRHPINMTKCSGAFYVFRNRPGIVKWVPGRLLPRRWGCGFFGLIEFGDRGH